MKHSIKLISRIITNSIFVYNKRILILIAICIIFTKIQAQNQLYFDYYNSQNGLSQNSVYSITQSKDGFMWFGTQEGINRFDGKYFTQINPNYNKSDSNEMDYGEFSKTINNLYLDSKDLIWVGTAKEISIYNRFTNKFYIPSYYYKNFSLPSDANIIHITEINHQLWVLTLNKRLFCYDIIKKQMLPVNIENNSLKKIISIQNDRQDHLWICDNKHVYQYENGIFKSQNDINEQIGISGITNMTIVNNDLWIITGLREIIYFNLEQNKSRTKHFFYKEYKGKSRITDASTIHQSSKDILWIGSRSNGLIKINLQSRMFESLSDYNQNPSLGNKFVLSFLLIVKILLG
ncbi:MAG: hypothetical protein IPL09_00960 [Bacteroidetes bacterium]|nr:hypothetical protein [Bacteroidota bacterium]